MPEKPEETATERRLESGPSPDPSRRTVLAATAAVAGACAAMVMVPLGVLFAAPALQGAEGEGEWVPLGPIEEFADGRVEREFSFKKQEGWYRASVTRRVVAGKEGEDWLVISTQCTHLGCGVTWEPEAQGGARFFCPCHNGVFDSGGNPVSGPPSRPLDRLQAKVESGILMVREA